MRSLRVDHIGSKPLVALGGFPEEHDDFWRELGDGLSTGDVGRVCLERLIQNPSHSIHDELKILWSV